MSILLVSSHCQFTLSVPYHSSPCQVHMSAPSGSSPCHSLYQFSLLVHSARSFCHSALYQFPPSVPSVSSLRQFPPSVPSVSSLRQFPPSVPSVSSLRQFPPSVPSVSSLRQFPPSVAWLKFLPIRRLQDSYMRSWTILTKLSKWLSWYFFLYWFF